jgi:dTMP kinase
VADPSRQRSTARFIVLEGIDGSGKSSQVAPLAEWLRGRGHTVVACRDPGATPAGDAIRQILLHRQEIPLAPTTEMLLYMAARAQLVAEVIAPALARGAWVVSDRYLPANIVYQGHAGDLDAEIIRGVGGVATGGVTPDLVLLLDLDPTTAARRIDRPLDRLESRGDDFRRRLREGYLREAAAAPTRFDIIDAAADMATVGERIRDAVERRLG